MKAKKCQLVINTRNGHICQPIDFPSISKAVAYTKECWGFAYRIFVDGKKVRSGFCENI